MVLAVVLENNVWTYFPGQTINGNVVVTKNIWHKIEGDFLVWIKAFNSFASDHNELFNKLQFYWSQSERLISYILSIGLSIRFLGKIEFGSAASAPTMPPEDTLPNYQQDRSILNRFTRRPVQETVLDNKLNVLHSCNEEKKLFRRSHF